jgi:hypothetical protein
MIDMQTIAITVGTGMLALFAALPKIMSAYKKDKLDSTITETQTTLIEQLAGSYKTQLAIMADRIDSMDNKIDTLNKHIDEQEITIRRVTSLILQMKLLLDIHNIPLPNKVLTELNQITKE